MDYFTSDLSINHNNIITYQKRPFTSVDEMNKCLIDNINKTVKDNDRLFLLGNFLFGPLNDDKFIKTARYFRRQINCRYISLVFGNHDRRARHNREFTRMFTDCSDYKEVKIQDQSLILTHYPIECGYWNRTRENSWHLHGHSYGLPSPSSPRVDVGVDNVWQYLGHKEPLKEDYRPLKFSEIQDRIIYNLSCQK